MSETFPPLSQSHGHVSPRPDGAKARCGGPAMCKVCQQEQAALTTHTAQAADRKAQRVHVLVNAGPYPGMSEAFNAHMGAACWTDPAYAPDASMWAAAWKAATHTAQAAESAGPACKSWRHAANEWADATCNALQGLRNIKAGISTLDDGIADVLRSIEHCRAAQPTAAEAPDAWRQAVDRELTAIGQTVDIYAAPEGALRALIDWHCAAQIDPAVSSAAAELVERGRREAAQAVRQGPVALTCDQAATALRMALQDMRAIKCDVVESASLVGYFRNRLKELASAAPQASQPVARVRFDSGEVHIVPLVRHVEGSPLKDGQTLYDSPQPPRPVALTDEQFAASLPDEVARNFPPQKDRRRLFRGVQRDPRK